MDADSEALKNGLAKLYPEIIAQIFEQVYELYLADEAEDAKSRKAGVIYGRNPPPGLLVGAGGEPVPIGREAFIQDFGSLSKGEVSAHHTIK